MKKEQKTVERSNDIRFSVCANIVANTVCADLLDYIHRDWHHVGKSRSFDDRIFQYMEVGRRLDGGEVIPLREALKPSCKDRFVIALEQAGRVRTDGVSAILGLLEWRYELAETVLFHRTKLAAGAMLDRALFELWGDGDAEGLAKTLPAKLLMLSDEQLLDVAAVEASQPQISKTETRKILEKLKFREIYKEVFSIHVESLSERLKNSLKHTYAGVDAPRGKGAENRARAARVLEQDFDLPSGSVAIYCAIVKPKIAEVSIAVDDVVQSLSDFEEENSDKLSGGHLSAQIRRFGRLNKLCVFIDRAALRTLSDAQRMDLHDHIANVVFSADPIDRLERRVFDRAELKVKRLRDGGSNSVRFVADPADAARGDPKVARQITYPNGAPSVWKFISRD